MTHLNRTGRGTWEGVLSHVSIRMLGRCNHQSIVLWACYRSLRQVKAKVMMRHVEEVKVCCGMLGWVGCWCDQGIVLWAWQQRGSSGPERERMWGVVRLAWLGEAGLVLRERGNDTRTGKYTGEKDLKTLHKLGYNWFMVPLSVPLLCLFSTLCSLDLFSDFSWWVKNLWILDKCRSANVWKVLAPIMSPRIPDPRVMPGERSPGREPAVCYTVCT